MNFSYLRYDKHSKRAVAASPDSIGGRLPCRRTKHSISPHLETDVSEKRPKTMYQSAEQRYQTETTGARRRNMIETDVRSSFGDQRDVPQSNYDPSRLIPNEQAIHLAGVLDEAYVYEHYSAILPGFDFGNWVSHLRNEYITFKWNGSLPPVSRVYWI
ncbi:hypothetical protein BC937DRAFT_93417 [Endogone sp. FLAS-F59071]|nr:hypothetical protein BC937DRAFT_93417 [Endogone sp. FLAS-F59071]|eukprot:RUS21174.1 hypothetical protein BC937DRAFT_93417 [Endogone sp. FLAS-F59071]